MFRPVLPALTVTCLAATCLAAAAQDRPLITPTRDVAVTYKVIGFDPGKTMQMAWMTANSLMRVDTPGGHGYMIIDRARRRAMMVLTEQRMYMELDPGQVSAPGTWPDDQAKFTRGGSETIAGTACTVWAYDAPSGTGTACMTADGVMLRASTADGKGLEAIRIAYGPQPAEQFQPPEGFQKREMPAAGGARPRRP